MIAYVFYVEKCGQYTQHIFEFRMPMMARGEVIKNLFRPWVHDSHSRQCHEDLLWRLSEPQLNTEVSPALWLQYMAICFTIGYAQLHDV